MFHGYASWLVRLSWVQFLVMWLLIVWIGSMLLPILLVPRPKLLDLDSGGRFRGTAHIDENGIVIGDPKKSGSFIKIDKSGIQIRSKSNKSIIVNESGLHLDTSSQQASTADAKGGHEEDKRWLQEASEIAVSNTVALTEYVHRGTMLNTLLAGLALALITATASLKFNYKGRMQAEGKVAAATEVAESEQLKRQVVEARMAAMQAQVEPHFLFNTLASIDHLITTDADRASAMQKNLIALLRAAMPTMRDASPAAHDLGSELAMVRPYLEILKMRMEARLDAHIEVPEGLMSAEFPTMMLQGLVENAIKHGLEPKPEGGTLAVRAEIVDGKLVVQVADTGLGFGKGNTAGSGTGLRNSRERLQLLYADKASLAVTENKPSGTMVTLSMPYQAHTDRSAAQGASA